MIGWVTGKRCDRKRGLQYNVRDIGLRTLHDNGVQAELVAPLQRLFLLRRIDSGDARYDFQRIDILVRRDSLDDPISLV